MSVTLSDKEYAAFLEFKSAARLLESEHKVMLSVLKAGRISEFDAVMDNQQEALQKLFAALAKVSK